MLAQELQEFRSCRMKRGIPGWRAPNVFFHVQKRFRLLPIGFPEGKNLFHRQNIAF
jgi:hypothetical protein